MSKEILAIVNAPVMWACAILLVGLVVVQSAVYVRMCFKEAAYIGYPTENLKKSFKLGMVTGFGPSLTSVVAMISMMTIVGSPITWMRLSIIGAVPTELGVASLTSQSQDLVMGGPGFTVPVISLIFLMMAITGTGWLLVVIFTTPSMGKIRTNLEKKDVVWFGVFTTATSIGLFSNLASQQLVKGGLGTYVASLSAFACMYLTHQVFGKKNKTLKSYALTISMVVGMIIASVVAPIY